MAALLYERSWSLTIVPPNTSQAVVFSSQSQQGIPLRFAFECDRHLGSDPNKGKFELTNLSLSLASRIQAGSLVILKAGYVGNRGIIYKGQVEKVGSEQNGPDLSTKLECGDGEPYIAYSHVQLSYKGTVTLAHVLQDIASKMNVTIGGQVYQVDGVIVQGIPNKTFTNLCISALLREALDGLLAPFGMSWSIQCGVLLIQNNQGTLTLRSTLLSEQTGLLSTPSKTDVGMHCQSLLIPAISPGNAVTISTRGGELNGNFRVVKAVYKGDTMGDEWSIEIDAQTLVNPLAPAPTITKKTDFAGAVDSGDGGGADMADEVAE